MANRCSRDLRPEGRSYLTIACQRLRGFDLSVAAAFRPEILLIGITLLLGISLAAQTPDRSQTEALAKRAAERLAALQREADALARQQRSLLVELRKFEVEREIKVEELAKVRRDTESVQQRLAAATAKTAQLQAEADRQRPDVEARLVQVYKMGRAGYWRLLLDVNSLREVGRAYRTAAALGRIDRDRVDEHRRTLAALSAERSSLQARAGELGALQRQAQQAAAAIERAVNARTALVKSIDERRDLNAQLAGELQEAQQKLQATLTATAAGRPAATARAPRSATGSNCRCPKGSRSRPFTAAWWRSPTSSAGMPTSSLSTTATARTRFTAISRAFPSKRETASRQGRPSGRPAGTQPATRPHTSSCASTAGPWIPYNG
jgi:septal ring factor EnvC (AmiA/AmiB activator)